MSIKWMTGEEFVKDSSLMTRLPEEFVRKYIFDGKKQISALEILDNQYLNAGEKLFTTLREELVDDSTLHEFSCQCIEKVLRLTKNYQTEISKLLNAKKAWMRGEITSREFDCIIFTEYESLYTDITEEYEISENEAYCWLIRNTDILSFLTYRNVWGPNTNRAEVCARCARDWLSSIKKKHSDTKEDLDMFMVGILRGLLCLHF